MTAASVDFETRSTVDLKMAGVDNYAKHPTTEAVCMSWRFDDGPVRRWPRDDVTEVLDHVRRGGVVKAFNAAFEIAIWTYIMAPRHRWPPLAVEQCRCTMARSYAMALPGALANAAPAAGVEERKDSAGHRLMLQMSKPRSVAPDGAITWWDDPERLEKLGQYCDQDVITESALDKRLMSLSAQEQALWVLDQRINNRGVYVDTLAVNKAIAVVQAEQDRLNARMRAVTGNFVGFCTEAARITKWVQSRGVPVEGIAKADVMDALELPDLPDDVREALVLRQEAGKSSTAKLRSMLTAVSSDGRLRHMFQFHGAGTGRWAGRRVQLHNMPRALLSHAELARALDVIVKNPPDVAIETLTLLYGPPLDIISWALKLFLTAAPGHDLLAADFKNIEGRALAWLAGEDWKVDAFRAYDAGRGPDLYLVNAARIWGVPVETYTEKSPERQHGKVGELACGYQGGVGAFQKMAKTYLVKVDDAVARRIVTGWREAHPNIVTYWYDLDRAAKSAVRNVGATTVVGPPGRQVKFRVKGSFLWCLLPSGRVLCYAYPRLDTGITYVLDGVTKKMSGRAHAQRGLPDGAEVTREDDNVLWYMHVNGMTNKWEETDTYGGKLSENVTQAICRDLLGDAMVRCEAAEYPVVLHVHDEVVSEVREGAGDLKDFEALCGETAAWADGLPVVASGWRRKRYSK